MSYQSGAYSAHNQNQSQLSSPPHELPFANAPDFDILVWYPFYQSCQQYFLDHAQHEPGTQALCALINIRLPFQWLSNPLRSSSQGSQHHNQDSNQPFNFSDSWPRPAPSSGSRNAQQTSSPPPAFVSLDPYVRRLVVTGFDKPGILHGFFGDAWMSGITPLQDCERRNYLFAAKHGGWRSCKKQYDLNAEETVPFMKPLQNVRQEELEAAEKSWSSWLAMEDWMIGPRAPSDGGFSESGTQSSSTARATGLESNLRDGMPDHMGRR